MNNIKIPAIAIKYKSSLCDLIKTFLLKILNKKKKFSMEKKRQIINIIFWKFVKIISFRESDGKNPPFDTKVIVKLRELKSLTPEIFSKKK